MFHRVHLHAKGGCVTQCQPEDTHGEFKPSNRNELLPQSPPFHAKGRRSTDPITNARAKVRTAPGMVLDTVKPTFQSIVQTPPPFLHKAECFSIEQTKENQTP